jgi:hypothetical protein
MNGFAHVAAVDHDQVGINLSQTVDDCDSPGQTATPAAASATRLVIAHGVARIKNVNYDGFVRRPQCRLANAST